MLSALDHDHPIPSESLSYVIALRWGLVISDIIHSLFRDRRTTTSSFHNFTLAPDIPTKQDSYILTFATMFTGLVSHPTSLRNATPAKFFVRQVEHVVTISSITPAESFEGFTFTFKNAAPILDDCHIGDSICVNGACLTVTEFDEDTFKVGLAPETLNRTNLGGFSDL